MKRIRRKNLQLPLAIVLLIGLGVTFFINRNLWTHKNANAAITLSAETQANNTTLTEQKETVTAVDGKGNILMIWTANNGTDDNIYGRRFDSQGNALDATDILINTSTSGDQNRPSIAADVHGNFIIAWSGNGTQSGQSDTDGVFLQAFQSIGGTVTPVGGEIRVNTTTTNSQTSPSIAMDTFDSTPSSVKFAIAYSSDQTTQFNTDIYVQRFTVDFTQTTNPPSLTGSETIINTTTTGSQDSPSIGMNQDGTYAVGWFGDGPTGSNRIWYRAFAADGTALDAEEKQVNVANALSGTSLTANQKFISASSSFGNTTTFILAWQGLFTSGIGTDDAAAARIITCTDPNPGNASDTDLTCSITSPELIATDTITGSQWNPRVAADGFGNFTVVWDDEQSGNHDIMGQSYTFRGKRIDDNFTVNTVTAGTQINPSIGMNRDGFYNIAYTNESSNNNFFHNYVNETAKVQTEVLAHAASGNSQATAATDIAPNGNHVEVWKDYTDGTIRYTLRSFDNDATAIQENIQVSAVGSVNNGNPTVSFFKDESGTGAGRFIIVWESDTTGDKNIYYQIYDAAGAPDGTTQTLNSVTTGNQTYPDVEAGCYMNTCDDSGTAEKIFAATYVDDNTNSIESAFNDGGLTYDTLRTCTGKICSEPRVSLYPYTIGQLHGAYIWTERDTNPPNAYVTKTIDGVQDGAIVAIGGVGAGSSHEKPDIAMSSNDTFIITYSRDPGTDGVIVAQEWNFNSSSVDPSSAENVHEISNYMSGSGDYVYPKIDFDLNGGYGLVVWTDLPVVSAENNIYAQFLENSTATGSTFRVNSTQSSDQTLPSIGLNSSGQAIVAWEGNVNQPSLSDTNGIATQLLWNPFISATPMDLTPIAQQEIQAGGQFLNVPSNIVFPSVALDTENPTTQTVTIRDAINGGDDLKYIQVEDATGVDFTLTVQASDFYAQEDGRPYITAENHFRVRNWDQDTADVDNPAECNTSAETCFTTISSSYSPTAFTLGIETETFTSANTQKVLAEKSGTTENEIGQWRIYPEFEITVPPLLPPGVHESTITFTLT